MATQSKRRLSSAILRRDVPPSARSACPCTSPRGSAAARAIQDDVSVYNPSLAGRSTPTTTGGDDSRARSVQRTNPGPPQAHSHRGRALVLWAGAAAWVKGRCRACDARALRQLKGHAPRVCSYSLLRWPWPPNVADARYRPTLPYAAPPKSGSSSPPLSAARCITAEVESRVVAPFSSHFDLDFRSGPI
jgi:hypothetical protein